MGILTKTFKVATSKADDLFATFGKKTTTKSAKTTSTRAAAAKTTVKDAANQGTIKTSSAIGNQGVTKATSGGLKQSSTTAVKNVAKGAASTAKVGGVVVAGSAIAAVPALVGTKVIDYYKDTQALTDEDRRYSFLVDTASKDPTYTDTSKTGDPSLDQDSTLYGNTGVTSGLSTGSPLFDASYGEGTTETEDTSGNGGLFGIGLAGLALVGGIGYIAYKNRKKISSKVKSVTK